MTHTIQAQIAENNITVQAQIETQIAPSGGVEVEPFSTSENGEFTAPQGKAYSPVNVSVPQTNVVPLSVNENGTTEAPAGTAYNPVAVAVPVKTEESLTVEQNGEYTPESGKVYNRVVANVPNTYTVQDEGKVVNSGALTAQTARTVTQNGAVDTTLNNSVTVNVPWLMQGPNPVENLGVIYEEEIALKDTGYATWTPSTTQATIQASFDCATFTADMINYEYSLVWEFEFDPVYQTGTEQKAMTTKNFQCYLVNMFKRQNTYEQYTQGLMNINAQVAVNLPVGVCLYYKTDGTLGAYTGTTSIFCANSGASFSNINVDTPLVTVKSLQVNARCNVNYFSTAAAAAIDQEKSKFKMRCTLYRTPIGGTMRQMYEALTDLYNNPIVINS